MPFRSVRLLLGILFLSLLSTHCLAQDSDYETIRFFNSRSKPEKLSSYAISPNGQLLAISFSRDFGGRKGISIIDLKKKELVSQIANFSYFTLAFSSDSRKLLGTGGYAGTKVFDIPGKQWQKVNVPLIHGKIGIDVKDRNGKLLVTQVFEGFNPTVGEQIRVGDEILAINEGEKPTRYKDDREWVSLLGKPLEKALEAMRGRPATWVQLRLARRGKSEPAEACIQRQWPANVAHKLPPSSNSLTLSVRKNVFQFQSADTLSLSAFAHLRDLRNDGLKTISDDAKSFASVANLADRSDFAVEVHSLADGITTQSTSLNENNFRALRFSPNGKQILVGTRDTVEILDVASGEWKEPVVLTAPEDADEGRVVTRRIPLGFGFPGDLYTTAREVVYAKPAALSMFDVSPVGTLAIASETGDIVLASLESKERVGLVGDNILGGKPSMIEFAPNGKTLVAYAQGMLHIFELGTGEEDSAIKTEATVGEPPN